MTKPELLLDAIGEVQDKYLEELDTHIANKSRKKRRNGLMIAACLCLVVGTVIFGWYRLAFGGGSCNYTTDGIAAGGYFYYEVPGNGFFRYTPEEGSVRLTHAGLADHMSGAWYSFTANDYGFYYTKDNWIYRIRHGETASEKIYHYEGKVSCPYMYPAGATDIAVYAAYEGGNTGFHNELFIIDGVTGERKTTIIDDNIRQEELDALPDVMSSEYDEAADALFSRPPIFADKVTYTVGNRTLELILEEGNSVFDYAYRLTENGKQLTEQYVEPYDVRTVGDGLAFVIGSDGSDIGYGAADYLIVYPDGTQQKLHPDPMGDSTLGDKNFCFTCVQWYGDGVKDMHTISAKRIRNVDIFELKWDSPDEWVNTLYSDDEYLWLTYFDRIACYKIEYSGEVPTELTLIDSDITNTSKGN